MATSKVGVIVGSNRKESINLKLAQALIKLAEGKAELALIKVDDMPLYNQDIEAAGLPDSVQRFKREVEAADGLIFVTPEYNRGTTPLMLNAISWGSRPYGKNSFKAKPAGLIGASAGPFRSSMAQQTLRAQLPILHIRLLGAPEAYVQFTDDFLDADGSIKDEKNRSFLAQWLQAVLGWVQQARPKAS